MPDDVN